MALTIRLNDEQKKMLNRLLELTGESRYSKALLKAAGEHEPLGEEVRTLKARVRELEKFIREIRGLEAEVEAGAAQVALANASRKKLVEESEALVPAARNSLSWEPQRPYEDIQ